MSEHKRALLIVGSPKPKGSTSEALGAYVVGRLEKAGFSTKAMHAGTELRGDGGQALAAMVDAADMVLLATPLYVDAAPTAVTRALELIARHRREVLPERRPRFAAIVNCGFPESFHCDTGLAVYRCFAREAGLEWAGGVGIGMGGAISGKAVDRLGGMGRNLRQGLDLMADALAEGKDVPGEAVELAGKPFMPRWAYVMMAQLGWRLQARPHKAGGRLRERPNG